MTSLKKSGATQACGNFHVNFKNISGFAVAILESVNQHPVLRAEKSNFLSGRHPMNASCFHGNMEP